MCMKLCGRCKTNKSFVDFRKSSKSKDGLQSWCRSCHSSYEKERWHNGDNLRKKANDARRVELNNRYVADYLHEHACVDCGEKDLRVLDFDHRDILQKHRNISDMIQANGLQMIIAEIAKCDIRCANCHRKRTSKQFSYWRDSYIPLDRPSVDVVG